MTGTHGSEWLDDVTKRLAVHRSSGPRWWWSSWRRFGWRLITEQLAREEVRARAKWRINEMRSDPVRGHLACVCADNRVPMSDPFCACPTPVPATYGQGPKAPRRPESPMPPAPKMSADRSLHRTPRPRCAEAEREDAGGLPPTAGAGGCGLTLY